MFPQLILGGVSFPGLLSGFAPTAGPAQGVEFVYIFLYIYFFIIFIYIYIHPTNSGSMTTSRYGRRLWLSPPPNNSRWIAKVWGNQVQEPAGIVCQGFSQGRTYKRIEFLEKWGDGSKFTNFRCRMMLTCRQLDAYPRYGGSTVSLWISHDFSVF